MSGMIQIERNPKPFEGQEKAITILDRNLLVSAGAGSGKTWVLTERYLEILSKGYSPSQIVAITFTEKAAGEMRERIRSSIRKLGAQAEDLHTKGFWKDREEELKYSLITTIHGFCARLLRSHPVEAGLDPEFSVMDGIDAGILIRDVFHEEVESFLEEESEHSLLLYEEFGQTNLIVEAVMTLFEQMQTYHKTPAELWEETEQCLQQQASMFQERLSALDQWVRELREEFSVIKSSTKKPPKYFSAFEDWMARYDRIFPELVGSKGILTDTLIAGIEDLVENKWTKSGPDHFKEMTDELRELKLPSVWECMLMPQYPQLLKVILELAKRAGERYDIAKRARQAVDFHDLEILAAKLLTRHAQVCQKWQKRVQFLMVDEFQDTNTLQKSLIDCLTGQGTKMRVFVVGDGKQSIYRFRGADVQIFYEMEKDILELGGEKVSLTKNFRTQSGIIGYINSLFDKLMHKNESDPPYYTVYESLDAHRQLSKPEPQIELIHTHKLVQEDHSSESEEVTEQHWVEVEADVLARRIKLMVEDEEKIVWRKDPYGEETASAVEYGDICILLAARSQMHLYEFALQEYGIPYQVVGGRQFYGKQEVLDVVNVLRVIHDPSDETALLGFLRSPFVQLSDTSLFWLTRSARLAHSFIHLVDKPAEMTPSQWDKFMQARSWISEWSKVSKWDSLTSLIQRVLQDSGYTLILTSDIMGEQKVANIDKLIRFSRQLVEKHGFHLVDFLQLINRMQEDSIQEEEATILENQANAVVIMSVHASKGLEFPVVCIPELRKDVLKKGGVTPSVLYQPEAGVALRLKDVEKEMPGNGFYNRLAAEEKDREIQEAKRLLYVAMTRARDHLILLGSESKGKNTWLQWIEDHLSIGPVKEIIQPMVIEQAEWKLQVSKADQIPTFPKQSDRSAAGWQQWRQQLDQLSDTELSPIPLLEGAETWRKKLIPTLPTLSASALMEYQRCPKSFYLKYVERIYGLDLLRGSLNDADTLNMDNGSHLSSSQVGSIVHHLIEQTKWDEHEVPHWGDLLEPTAKRLGFEMQTLSERNRYAIEKFHHSFQSFVNELQDGKFETEKQLLALLVQQKITGTLDLLQHHPDGTVSIYDFKTNHIHQSIDHVVQPYLWQGYLYALLTEAVIGKKVAAMQFVFLDTGEKFTLDLSERERTAFTARLHQLLADMHTALINDSFTCCVDKDCICSLFE